MNRSFCLRTPRAALSATVLPTVLPTLTAALLAASFASVTAQAATRRVVLPNEDGGTTSRVVKAHEGPHGASAARGRVVKTDGAGDATITSRAAAVGARGSVQTSASATRSADGQLAQNRTATATSASTGSSAHTTSSYNSDTGRTRATTCYDAAGSTIACPARP